MWNCPRLNINEEPHPFKFKIVASLTKKIGSGFARDVSVYLPGPA
jgi:hypothetical protein